MKIGTPEAALAKLIPKHIKEVVPTIFAIKTIKPIATPLEQFVLRCIKAIALSK